MNRLRALALAALVAIGLGAVGAAPGEASPAPGSAPLAVDTTPPSLVVDPFPRYLLGSQIDSWYDDSYWGAYYRVQWKVSDPSGICSQTVDWGDKYGTWNYPLTPKQRTIDFLEEKDAYDPGPDTFKIHSTDCAGNTATAPTAVTQFGIREDSDPGINYKGKWSVSRFQGFTEGTTRYSTKAGDSFTTTFTGNGPVALVMEKAANRGSADVYVDGVFRKTINTNAATTKHRVVVWQAIYKPGTHTLRVVNRGTAGHPRIDLDAVLMCQGIDTGFSC